MHSNSQKEKEAKRNKRKTAFLKLWIMSQLWKLMDNSLVKRLVELPTIPTIAWTTPLIQQLVGVAHSFHNTAATSSFE